MKAVRIHQFGGPEVLTYEDVPDPKPRKDQVLIRVRACSLNHLDIWVRKGLPGVNLPHILGSDMAGEIVEVGEYVTDLKPGQRVLVAPMHFCHRCAKCAAGLQNQCRQFTVIGNAVDGGNCELFAAPAVNVIPIPNSLDFNEAASVPLVFVTAWHMLTGRAAIRPGQTVLVLGANSGVGIAAIQIAKMFHARVIATAGDERKMERAGELGADFVINHYQQKISQEVRKITNFEGVDIVVEHVGPGHLAGKRQVAQNRRDASDLWRNHGTESGTRPAVSVLAPAFIAWFIHGDDERTPRSARACVRRTPQADHRPYVPVEGDTHGPRVHGEEPDVREDRAEPVRGSHGRDAESAEEFKSSEW